MHGARGGAKALILKHRGFLLRKREGGGKQRGKRSRRKRSLIVTCPLMHKSHPKCTEPRGRKENEEEEERGGGK